MRQVPSFFHFLQKNLISSKLDHEIPVKAIDVYEWNSLAISMIEFRHVDSRAIRPTWSDIFTHQTRVATDLNVSWRQISFSYRHRYWLRSLGDLGKLNTGGLFYCKTVFPNKFKIIQTRGVRFGNSNPNRRSFKMYYHDF